MDRALRLMTSIGVPLFFTVVVTIGAVAPATAALPPTGVYSFFDGQRGTLTVTATGAFTGKWMWSGTFDPPGPYSYENTVARPLSGSFDASGTGSILLSESVDGDSRTFLRLTFVPGDEPTIKGELVSLGRFNDVIYMFTAWPVKPAGVLAGSYTAILGASEPPSTVPKGTGWAVLTVKPGGGVSIRGRTGDGRAFSTAAKLRSDNKFWFGFSVITVIIYSGVNLHYLPLLKERELEGLVEVRTAGVAPEMEGLLFWKYQKETTTLINGELIDTVRGFSSDVTLRGSRYTPPAARTLVFDVGPGVDPKLAHPVAMTLEFGGLADSQTSTFTITLRQGSTRAADLTAPIQQLQSYSIDAPATGVLGGTFQGLLQFDGDPTPRRFSGVILQNENAGFGLFQGPADDRNSTGTIGMIPVPLPE